MKVKLLAYPQDVEKIVAAAAKLCYAQSDIDTLWDGLDEKKSADFVQMLASVGHESPIEHVSFTFGIEGVSRALLAQITRHRIASFSVQSQRYVKEKQFAFVMPPAIEADEEAKRLFLEAMDYDIRIYNRIADTLQEKYVAQYVADGMDEKTARQRAEKKAIEDARFVLPNACDTKMLVTMNARSLLNFFRLRCCNRAQWEIKAVADEMLRLCCEVAPTLFRNAGPGCVRGNCPEGKMSCGRQQEVQNFYRELKESCRAGQ